MLQENISNYSINYLPNSLTGNKYTYDADHILNKNFTYKNNISIFDYLKNKNMNELSYNLLFKSKRIQTNKLSSDNNTVFEDIKEFKNAVIHKFKTSIVSEDLEFGLIGNTTVEMKKFLLINADYTINALSQFAIDNFDNINIVYSVLHTFAHLEYDLIKPGGITFALAASQHQNIEIQDFSIQCFDMWENKDSLGYLKIITIKTPWLNNYLQEVIENIESINE